MEQREIKFRGIRKDNNQWVYGSLVNTFQAEICDDSSISGFREEVIPETVGQYTGLNDKNGTKIFEGDIIEYTQALFNTLSEKWPTKQKEVKFNTLRGSWNIFETEAGEFDFKIIGNIHESSEGVKTNL